MEHQSRVQKIIMAVLLIVAMAITGIVTAQCVLEHKKGESAFSEEEETKESENKSESLNGAKQFAGYYSENSGITVVIDAGHGGDDPGKVGVNGEKEKDINLEIAKLLEEELNHNGIQTVMTRTEDEALYGEEDGNKKVADLKHRLEVFESNEPVLGVSIHQNSYRDASVRGPQVFYYTTSPRGEQAATMIQNSMNQMLEIARPRVQKGNTTYFILKKSQVPIVIVECGFLSNPQDAALLSDSEYKKKVAKAVTKGIMDYIEQWKKEEEVFLFIS